MIDAEMIRNLMKRVERLEAQLASLPRPVDDSNDPRPDDQDGFNRAINELAAGNRKPLSNFIKRGGKIPC